MPDDIHGPHCDGCRELALITDNERLAAELEAARAQREQDLSDFAANYAHVTTQLEAARAEVERLQAGLASVEDFARVQALSDRVRSGPARSTYHSEERYWLDLLALIERAQGARP